MEITNFDRLRVKSDTFCFMDIEKIGNNSSNGLMATAYLMGAIQDYINQKVEVRRKDNYITVISYHYDDIEIPEYWRDAEVIFSWSDKGGEVVKGEDTP
ncbi:30S ribosomal protein S16 [Paenibacillus polymyxa]|uniref:hypothetical protein n=1 Tax=Paenibacillus polymyxa TaxID=1406 RepID=UPI0008FB9584|nr:hypothetical protein [Paenibacillus polymyxa]APB77416.1 30S ribosomal protein S16 [Paenibacillus polymyxa]